MDFVYICRTGPNEELRYSIRSVMNSFPDAKIWVSGGKPDWYIGNYISIDQNGSKYANAIANINAICDSKEISDDFVLMNDDFFILKKIDSIKTFHSGLLIDKITRFKEVARSSAYINKLVLTQKFLNKYGIENPLDYELHIPMVMNKYKLKDIIREDEFALWRSLYGNMYNVKGEYTLDVKIYHEESSRPVSYNITEDSIYVSTDDRSFSGLFSSTLKKSFPNKSIYEA